MRCKRVAHTGGRQTVPQTTESYRRKWTPGTPDQYRRQAARLRATGDPNLIKLAEQVDVVAYVKEQRLNMSTPSPPIAPST